MRTNDKIGIVCCSNGQLSVYEEQNKLLAKTLISLGLQPVFSNFIYVKDGALCGSGEERANALMSFYKDESIKLICDISGGDVANEILDYLDYDIISKSKKTLWGYSDLTTLLNAIYTKTGNRSVLFQLKNLVYDFKEIQQRNFIESELYGKNSLYQYSYKFVQGTQMEGIVIGGNIRCFLKLAGTDYFPNMAGKLLLLEAYGGETSQMITYFSQLKQIGVFNKISGVILGTFTKMEKNSCEPTIAKLLLQYVDRQLPIIKTKEIGHGADAKAINIGGFRQFM